jgi:hypothetical protein
MKNILQRKKDRERERERKETYTKLSRDEKRR